MHGLLDACTEQRTTVSTRASRVAVWQGKARQGTPGHGPQACSTSLRWRCWCCWRSFRRWEGTCGSRRRQATVPRRGAPRTKTHTPIQRLVAPGPRPAQAGSTPATFHGYFGRDEAKRGGAGHAVSRYERSPCDRATLNCDSRGGQKGPEKGGGAEQCANVFGAELGIIPQLFPPVGVSHAARSAGSHESLVVPDPYMSCDAQSARRVGHLNCSMQPCAACGLSVFCGRAQSCPPGPWQPGQLRAGCEAN